MSSKIFRPIPRRPVLIDSSQNLSTPLISSELSDEIPPRTHSSVNLTSSTLLGIFSPTTYDSEPENFSTIGASDAKKSWKSPLSPSVPVRFNCSNRPSKKVRAVDLGLRVVLLFAIGMSYGFLLQNLHDKPLLNSFKPGNLTSQNIKGINLFLWGVYGVVFGSLLPRVDTSFYLNKNSLDSTRTSASNLDMIVKNDKDNILRQDWTPVIRSIGAFIGIVYALRKLPWSSTFQASLALSLVNPVLWYLIDRSKSGLLLSLATGTTGTTILLVSKSVTIISLVTKSPLKVYNTALILSDMQEKDILWGMVNQETLEDAIWILSVLFCSCVCFGNIGRRLALNRKE